jgi:hypothetical protein
MSRRCAAGAYNICWFLTWVHIFLISIGSCDGRIKIVTRQNFGGQICWKSIFLVALHVAFMKQFREHGTSEVKKAECACEEGSSLISQPGYKRRTTVADI